jgi:hypothetical protein
MELPYQLRCRAALLALPSAYPNPKDAESASPKVNKGQLQLTFQQHSLAVNISEAILFLQRPYFLKALHEDPIDPSRSQHGLAFLAVVERCSVCGHDLVRVPRRTGLADAYLRLVSIGHHCTRQEHQ